MSKEFRYSESFRSIQGEGQYCGVPTMWLRSFGCNLTCKGFGQAHLPKNEWKDPAKQIDFSKINNLDELPVFKYGCDSAYSHYKEYRDLCPKDTAQGIAASICEYLPNGKFRHPDNGFDYHMAFTGGEPLMAQTMIVDVMKEFETNKNRPKYVTIETNGTQTLRDNFKEYFSPLSSDWSDGIERRLELFFSISPKLYLSGEKWDNAIKPEVVGQYAKLSDAGQLKYVCDNSQKAWDEIEKATELYRKAGVNYPVHIMPVGGLKEDQETIQREVAEACIERGYNFAPRLHCWIWGNEIGR